MQKNGKSLRNGVAAWLLFSAAVPAYCNYDINIIPEPNNIIVKNEGYFEFNSGTRLVCDKELPDLARLAETYMGPEFEFGYCWYDRTTEVNSVILRLDPNGCAHLGDEGYLLSIKPQRILIRAKKTAGLFYGLQTMRQLLPPESLADSRASKVKWHVPCVEIEDSPRFGWRGFHVDVSRHFLPIEFIKKYIDVMALYKFNRFDWHLVDDQGWRIEIKRYPKLTEVGAWRAGTLNHRDIAPGEEPIFEKQRYGGYYTQEEIRDVVKYAKDRFIEIIPEIEMPGHNCAAVAAYPWLACSGKPIEVPVKVWVFEHAYCPAKEEVYQFNENVLKEVMDLFPSKFIGIGADEVIKTGWEKCPKCRNLMEYEDMTDANGLQDYFVKRIEKFLIDNGRRPLAADEVLNAGIEKETIIICWRDYKAAIRAAGQGNDVLMNLRYNTYFDYFQGNPAWEPLSHSIFQPIERVYNFDPTGEIAAADQQHILGMQFSVWTQDMDSPYLVEYSTFPRACAISEVAWTANAKKDFSHFKQKIDAQYAAFDALGVNYYREPQHPKAENAVRVMAYNIMAGGKPTQPRTWGWHNISTKSSDRVDDIIEILKESNADIMNLQECDGWAAENGKVANYVAGKLGMKCTLISQSKPESAILSRYPVSNVGLNDADSYITADINLPSGKIARLVFMNLNKKLADADRFDALLKKLDGSCSALIIYGNIGYSFNKNAATKPLRDCLAKAGYTDAFLAINKAYRGVSLPTSFIFAKPALMSKISDSEIIYSMKTFETSYSLPLWADIKFE